jgi:hypothetical protein
MIKLSEAQTTVLRPGPDGNIYQLLLLILHDDEILHPNGYSYPQICLRVGMSVNEVQDALTNLAAVLPLAGQEKE